MTKKTGLLVAAAAIMLVGVWFGLNGIEPVSVLGIGIATLALAAVPLLRTTRKRPTYSRAVLALSATACFFLLLGAPPANATDTPGCGVYEEPAGGVCPDQDAVTEECEKHKSDECKIGSATCDPATLTIKCVYGKKKK